MSEEMKIVINLNGQAATVGIQKPDCDPFFSKVEGDLQTVLASVPRLVEEAQRTWESNSRYPKCETELKPPTPATTATPQRSSPRQTQSTSQPVMF